MNLEDIVRIYIRRMRPRAQALGLEGKIESLEVCKFPPEFQQLKPYEIEDVLCIFKDELKVVGAKHTEDDFKRSLCG